DEFEVALTSDDKALVRKGDWSDHAVRVLLDPSTGELRVHVVEDEREGIADDAGAMREREWCADRPALVRALAAHGIRIDALQLTPAGVVPVAKTSLRRATFTAESTRARGSKKERTR